MASPARVSASRACFGWASFSWEILFSVYTEIDMVKDKPKKVGTLLPLQSLRSEKEKRASFKTGELFLDWLAQTNQKLWQLLPLHFSERSPYKGYGIGLDERFGTNENWPEARIENFIAENQDWLEIYAWFEVLKNHFRESDWRRWPEDIRKKDPKVISKMKTKFKPMIEEAKKRQAKTHLAYEKMKNKAGNLKIDLIGDLPFYLDLKSPLVWWHQNLFKWGKNFELELVSGIPLTKNSYFGRQVWNHPLYDWSNDKDNQIKKLFLMRIKHLSQLFDWIRLDYAKGFFKFGVIDLKTGQDYYFPGPGTNLLRSLVKVGQNWGLKFFAENTGDKTSALNSFLKRERIPGIKILRYAYDEKQKKFVENYLRLDAYPPDSLVYTTTHDTEPLRSYLESLPKKILDELKQEWEIEKKIKGRQLAREIIKRLVNSPAKMVLIPLQDWLYTKNRINTPGTENLPKFKNWQYVMEVPIEKLPLDIS